VYPRIRALWILQEEIAVKIMGIDPGSQKSGYVIWDGGLVESGHILNEELRLHITKHHFLDRVAIERIRGYGIVAGDDTFDSCEWVGRFEITARLGGVPCIDLIPRKNIKRHLCGNTTTNDKYIRQALIDRLGEVGTKKNPGPLFGISGHLWAALAVAITCADEIKEAECKIQIEVV
jgi:hypothetical protein